MLPQNLLLAPVNVTQTNVDQLLGAQHVVGLQPSKDVLSRLGRKASQKRDGHSVDVAAVRGLGGVDVGMCVDPDDGDFASQALADCPCCAGNGANSDGVVAAEGQDELSRLCVVVDLFADFLCNGASKFRPLHAAVVGVVGWQHLRVVVYLAVEGDLEVQVFLELLDQAGLDQRHGSSINTWLWLEGVLGGFGQLQ